MNYTRDPVPRPTGRPHLAPRKVAEGPFDPDDLTRRLYVVLAEQKAQAERKQRARQERVQRKDGQRVSSTNRPRDGAPRPAREERKPKPAAPPADLITELRRSGSSKRNKPSRPAPDAAADEPPQPPTTQHHYIPREAAKQFTRTTTVENMRGSNSDLVHTLSKRALKYHTDGPRHTTTHQNTITSPSELSRALQQSQAHREKVLDRNQFQRTFVVDAKAEGSKDEATGSGSGSEGRRGWG
ncbi:hypothetical protein N0V88_000318 [Collariella sp. IMI 366227]|nr:hypothetical protein N0V88_000318 [Collariella sp. IMI 366227]